MPAKGGHINWFSELYGFEEAQNSYAKNRTHFRMDGDVLVCETSKWQRQHVGPFEAPSVAELQQRCRDLGGGATAGASGGLRFKHLADPIGVASLISNPANAGAVFQAASQFNALEMTGPSVTPKQGIAIYATDPTQGPKCALACPAGTVYRNYLCNDGKGQGETQLDCLADVGRLVGNIDAQGGPVYWTMQNGYALPVTTQAMATLGAKLASDVQLAQAAAGAVRVGVMWDTQAKPPLTHRVTQVFASALPVAYAKDTKSADWEAFARLVLRAAYEATLGVARIRATKTEGGRARVYLTALGAGAFGNRQAWVADAMASALDVFREAPLDVFLVHYGTQVKSEWTSRVKER